MNGLDSMILAIPLQEALLMVEKAGLNPEIEHTVPLGRFAGGIERVVRARISGNNVQIIAAREQLSNEC